MTEENDVAQRFVPRIREELDKLPLTDVQKENVIPAILKNARFLDTGNGKYAEGNNLNGRSGVFDFADKMQSIVDHFKKEGLTLSQYVESAITHPPLFAQSPATIAGNIGGVVERFATEGITTKDYLRAVCKRRPQLFCQSPATVLGNIEGVVKHFEETGITTQSYVDAAIRQPTLFTMSPGTITGNIEGVVERFAADGLAMKDYLQAALKQPPLFYQSPATIASNIEGVVKHFAADGLTVKDYLRVAVKAPPLFTMSPGTIAGNIEGVVKHFATDGLTTRKYLQAALKQPTLFYQSLVTIARHIDIVFDLADRGIFQPPGLKNRSPLGRDASYGNIHAAVIDYLLTNPTILSLADDNFRLREVHQLMTEGTTSSTLLKKSRGHVEHELMRHLGHEDPAQPVPSDGFVAGQPSPTDEQAGRFVLRALIRAGYIKGGATER